MRLVVALGGNALLQRGERPDAAVQLRNLAAATPALARLAAEHQVVLTHGNGPQIGRSRWRVRPMSRCRCRTHWTPSAPKPKGCSGIGSCGSWPASCRAQIVAVLTRPSSPPTIRVRRAHQVRRADL
jgi:hypothetical protein